LWYNVRYARQRGRYDLAVQGMLHLYMGNGKGKTTAAIGLCVRASGQGMRVVFAQFLKGGMSGERKTLSGISNISLISVPKTVKFTRDMDSEELKECGRLTMQQFRDACSKANDADLLVLDELADAIGVGLADEKEVLDFIEHKPYNLEIVLTGRSPSPMLIEKADYITNMVCGRHPHEKGLTARRGIEY
jgi:cob(I)alamin adenosyltransferase